MMMRCLILSLLAVTAQSFVPFVAQSRTTTSTTSLLATESRRDFVVNTLVGTVGSTLLTTLPAFADDDQVVKLENGVSYEIIKKGDGPQPEVGELVGIRFKATFEKIVLDDIFETPEPYYTRVGSGGMLKGVEETLPMMRLGDRWKLTIPGNLAFGKKGRPASAGKPRIPADATIIFDVEMVTLPGKEPELIELIGDV